MKAFGIGLALLLTLSMASAEPFVVIVRHAEKASNNEKDPDLSLVGQARSKVLAEMLKDSAISAIFTTEFKRTAETAAPTAAALGISTTVVPANDNRTLIEKLRTLKGNALVVGHGNTIPSLTKALRIETSVDIQENDYNQVFVVALGEKPQLLRLHYPDGLPTLAPTK